MNKNHEKLSLKQAFDAAYATLNEGQRAAVDAIDGPVMVIAGPGTGKTQILTLRIANILLQTDTAPESILALTFTEAGAKAMRQRLRRYIGTRAYLVPIYTFHGFAEKLIKEYPDAYGRIIGGRPASELEKITIVESVLDGGGIKLLRPVGDPAYYVRHITRIINELKKEYINPDGLAGIVNGMEVDLDGMEKVHSKGVHKGKVKGDYAKKAKAIEKNRELTMIYRQYEAMLRSKRLYDFEDMISLTVEALQQNEDMVRDLQERYHYFLADEHQDVNGSQNLILELLAKNPFHDNPNIFVVGDEKQAIYRFQGASLENFLYFKEQFLGTKEIRLTENYRSGQTILDAAHSLVAVEDGPLSLLRVPLHARAVSSSVVSRRTFSHSAVEDTWLKEAVLAEIASGTAPEEIAVIVRTNREVESCATLLRRAGIGVEASADGDILEHPITHAIEALLSAVVAERNETALCTVLHGSYWGLTVGDVMRILRARTYDRPLIDILSSGNTLLTLGLGDEAVSRAEKIHSVLQTARSRMVTDAPHRIIEYVVVNSGLLDQVIKHDAFEAKRVIRRLYDEVESLVVTNKVANLQDVIRMFAQTRDHTLSLNAPYINTTLKAVQVMTAHKSKGLEFSVVFVPHLQDNLWGGGSQKTYFDIPLQKRANDAIADGIDDEKRLLYVAMTRAKMHLYFSSSDMNGAGKVLMPTRLFDEIDAAHIQAKATLVVEDSFDPIGLFKEAPPRAVIDKALILHSLTHKGFSATSFNNYLKNPWDYIYNNVLQIPKVQETHLQFGTVIHSVLEFVTKNHTQTGLVPTTTHIKAKLEQALGRLPLGNAEYTRLHLQGMEVLVSYVEHMVSKGLPIATREEFKVQVVLKTGLSELPELPLTGNLDRLDFDAFGNVLQVVDYKTGKAKTRNALEGKTASEDGRYKRQLVFYALLLKLYGDERYVTKRGVLSFVQATPKGEIIEVPFMVTDEEITELEKLLVAAVATLLSEDWQKNGEIRKNSEYAHLLSLLEEMES